MKCNKTRKVLMSHFNVKSKNVFGPNLCKNVDQDAFFVTFFLKFVSTLFMGNNRIFNTKPERLL